MGTVKSLLEGKLRQIAARPGSATQPQRKRPQAGEVAIIQCASLGEMPRRSADDASHSERLVIVGYQPMMARMDWAIVEPDECMHHIDLQPFEAMILK